MLLWKDPAGNDRGHCLSSISYPTIPTEDDVPKIFADIEPYFAKRWLSIKLQLGAPIRGEFETDDADDPTKPPPPTAVGAGAQVEVLACHASGFAREPTQGVAHVTQCEPILFKGVSDDAGVAKLCFLPAEVNKIRVKETEIYQAAEVDIKKDELYSLDKGPTEITIELTPKALASLKVHVFELPATLPQTAEADGQIDWAMETLNYISGTSVTLTPSKEGARTLTMNPTGSTGVHDLHNHPEGFVELELNCSGYKAESKMVMLLVGENEFYIPLKKA